MKRAFEAKRSSKRELFTINDNEPNEPKAVKIKSEPVSSSLEVIRLRQQVAELQQAMVALETDYQGACRIAREAQTRVQFLENLLDSDSMPNDVMKNTEREDALEKRVTDLAHELQEVRVDRITRLAKLNSQLDEAKQVIEHSNCTNHELMRENERLKFEMAEMRRLAPQPTEAQQQESWLQQIMRTVRPQSQQMQQQMPRAESTLQWEPVPQAKRHASAHPTNILQMCHPKALGTFSLDSAHKKLHELMNDHGWSTVYDYFSTRMEKENYADLECDACGKTLIDYHDVLGHFLSSDHINNVRYYGAAVSLPAYQHWFLPLHQTAAAEVAAAAAVLTARLAAPAAVAVPRVDGVKKGSNVKSE